MASMIRFRRNGLSVTSHGQPPFIFSIVMNVYNARPISPSIDSILAQTL